MKMRPLSLFLLFGLFAWLAAAPARAAAPSQSGAPTATLAPLATPTPAVTPAATPAPGPVELYQTCVDKGLLYCLPDLWSVLHWWVVGLAVLAALGALVWGFLKSASAEGGKLAAG